MQPQANAVPQCVTTQPQQIVGVPANTAVILKMSDITQISVGKSAIESTLQICYSYLRNNVQAYEFKIGIFLCFH